MRRRAFIGLTFFYSTECVVAWHFPDETLAVVLVISVVVLLYSEFKLLKT